MELIFSREFEKQLKKLKDSALKQMLQKSIEKIMLMPESGKPLLYNLKGKRSLKRPPFRILYALNGDQVIIYSFEHRQKVYH